MRNLIATDIIAPWLRWMRVLTKYGYIYVLTSIARAFIHLRNISKREIPLFLE